MFYSSVCGQLEYLVIFNENSMTSVQKIKVLVLLELITLWVLFVEELIIATLGIKHH